MINPLMHVLTAQYPIAATTTVEPGQVIALDTNGYAVLADADGSGALPVPIGLSADRNRAAEAYEWQNRLSDMGNQTAAGGSTMQTMTRRRLMGFEGCTMGEAATIDRETLSSLRLIPRAGECGRSSAVERRPSMPNVASSNLVARFQPKCLGTQAMRS